MVGPERIGCWIDQLSVEQAKNGGELSVETAKTMLALCACIQATVSGFLATYDLKESAHGKEKA